MKSILGNSGSVCFKGLHQVKVDGSTATGRILIFDFVVPEIGFVTPGPKPVVFVCVDALRGDALIVSFAEVGAGIYEDITGKKHRFFCRGCFISIAATEKNRYSEQRQAYREQVFRGGPVWGKTVFSSVHYSYPP